jgi:hypothetical protein
MTNNVTVSSHGHAETSIKTQLIKLALIHCDCGTQSRAAINTDTVKEYAEEMIEGAKFPPAEVFFDGSEYYLADGFHRVMAASRNGFLDFECHVHLGTKSDALLFSLGANARHGLKRTNADKRRSVELALAEWPDWSDRKIADVCAVGNALVGEVRRELFESNSSLGKKFRVGTDGKKRHLPHVQSPMPDCNSEPAPMCEDEQLPVSGSCQELPQEEAPKLSTSAESPKPALESMEDFDEAVDAVAARNPECSDLKSEVRYHVDLVLEDAKLILDYLDTDTFDRDALEQAARQQFFCAKMLKMFAKTLATDSVN